MMYLVVVYDDNKCQKKIIFDGLQMDVRKLSLCLPCQNASIGMQHDTAMASFDLGVPWPEVKFWSWFFVVAMHYSPTYKKHSGALGFAVISIIKKLFSKRFRLKRSLIFTFSPPSVTNDTQETEITTDKNWDNDRILRPWLWFQVPVRPTSSRGRPRRVCMCVCARPRDTQSSIASDWPVLTTEFVRANVHKW